MPKEMINYSGESQGGCLSNKKTTLYLPLRTCKLGLKWLGQDSFILSLQQCLLDTDFDRVQEPRYPIFTVILCRPLVYIWSSLLFPSLERSLQDLEFRSSFHGKSFERAPYPENPRAKLRAVPDTMFLWDEMRVIQLPWSLLWIELCGPHWTPGGSEGRGRQRLPRGRGQWILGLVNVRIKIRRIEMIICWIHHI